MDSAGMGRQVRSVIRTHGARTDDFSIGRVIARGLGAVACRPVATFVPALLFGVLPALLASYAAEGNSDDLEFAIALIAAALWVAAVTNVLSQGALTRVVLDGGRSIRYEMRPAVRSLGPLLAAGTLVGAATVAVGALLLIPGLLLYALWSVAGPAIVEERLGALGGLRRSAALVRPVFWRVVLLNLIALLAYFAFWVALGLAGLYLWHGPAVITGDGDFPLPLGGYILAEPFITAATAAWGAVIVALYADLRERLDGMPADRLARIFA